MQFAASVTFGGVIEITNAIGGVEVCLANPIKDRYTGLDMEAGTHWLQGPRRCSSCAPGTASATAATWDASATSSSTCRASRAR